MALMFSALSMIIGLKLMAFPKTAKMGNLLAALGMILAIFVTLFMEKPLKLALVLLIMLLGTVLGFFVSKKVKMTAMPQLVAALNGFGGLSSLLVALSEVERLIFKGEPILNAFIVFSWFSLVIGAITFSGSFIAYLKLEEYFSKSFIVLGQRFITILISLFTVLSVFYLIYNPLDICGYLIAGLFALILGVLLVLPIGGADMPVVISLLNSYSGIAAMGAGFLVNSNILIIAGALVGASGIILTRLMCQAMNRSLMNVVFGAFTKILQSQIKKDEKPTREFLPMDVAMLLSSASKVIVVPGYGLAVSQAQRNLRELSDELKARNIDIAYAIHPVAGRMPGHMNVLLAEADVPYNELFDIDAINSEFENADVAIIVGANDVVNPDARSDNTSPLYGMPILNADKARTVVVLKRGKGKGFSGVENPLFTLENTGLIYGDAKPSLVKILQDLKTL